MYNFHRALLKIFHREYQFERLELKEGDIVYVDINGKAVPAIYGKDDKIYYEADGFIIDTKAYEKGFSITSHQRDEMSRYINDNQKRDSNINPNTI